MSWSRTQLAAFSAQTAAHRAAAFAGELDVDGKNVQIDATKYQLAFVRFEQTTEIIEEGYRYSTDATLHLPDSLSLTVAILDELTYTPRSETYRIDAIVESPNSGYRKLVLRRVNGGGT